MLADIVAAPRPLVLLTGASGTGKTTLLARLSDRLRHDGGRMMAIRATARGDLLPIRFAPGEHAVRLPTPDQAGIALVYPVPGAAGDPELARRAAATIAAQLPPGGTLVVDDAQWLDPDSLAVLHALVRANVRCVCAVRTPAPVPELLHDLRAADLVDEFHLTPWTQRVVTREVTDLLGATPEPALTRRVRRLSRGLPAALRAAVEALRHNGCIQIVDRTAYLVRPHTPLTPPADIQLVEAVRELGDACWTAATALAVLAPLGPAVPAVLAEVLRVPETEAEELLRRLREAGVVHRGGWRFVVPLVGAALSTCLGPFERRQLSAAVVTAVWSGAAACPDRNYLADRIADAGALVDTDRAFRELLRQAAAVRDDRAEAALPWLAAAADLARDDRQRALVLLMRTTVCFLLGDYEECLSCARRLLGDHAGHLPPDSTQEVRAMATAALGATGDHDALHTLATGGSSIVTRALAYGQLDRWQEVRDTLGADRGAENPTSAMFGELTRTMAELWTGRPERFEHSLANRESWPLRSVRRHLLTQVESHVTALLVTGDRHRAEQLLADEGLTAHDLPPHCRSMLAAARGAATEAVDLARRGVVGAGNRGYESRSAGMPASTVAVLVARGELTAARQLLELARATPPTLAHLLDIAEAQLDRAFGDDEGARTRLQRCAAQTPARVGMDLVWSELVDLALERGDRTEAERALSELTRLSPSSRVTLLTLLARATVEKDHEAARECERLARHRGQPLEQAIVLERLVRHGQCEPGLLGEAYDLLGTLDAVLYRAWLRNLMREHAVPVPGRKETVAENERLLAMLAAGGLSNKQLAAALRTSDKSVEGRLSRLFSRTGYRSRIELSRAMLTGEYV